MMLAGLFLSVGISLAQTKVTGTVVMQALVPLPIMMETSPSTFLRA